MFDEALQRAMELDEYLRVTQKTVGPLHGLPISLKDSFRVRGTNSAIGCALLADRLYRCSQMTFSILIATTTSPVRL